MADTVAELPSYEEKRVPSSIDDSIDDKKVDDDVQMVKEVEELEERIELDEATEDEYLVQNAYDVAIKVVDSCAKMRIS